MSRPAPVVAELQPDPALARLGLPVWTARHGTVHSEPTRLVVAAR